MVVCDMNLILLIKQWVVASPPSEVAASCCYLQSWSKHEDICSKTKAKTWTAQKLCTRPTRLMFISPFFGCRTAPFFVSNVTWRTHPSDIPEDKNKQINRCLGPRSDLPSAKTHAPPVTQELPVSYNFHILWIYIHLITSLYIYKLSWMVPNSFESLSHVQLYHCSWAPMGIWWTMLGMGSKCTRGTIPATRAAHTLASTSRVTKTRRTYSWCKKMHQLCWGQNP